MIEILDWNIFNLQIVRSNCILGTTIGANLDRGRAESENFVTSAFGIAVHVDEDLDTVRVDPVGSLPIARDLK